jgi:hypothetical protein
MNFLLKKLYVYVFYDSVFFVEILSLQPWFQFTFTFYIYIFHLHLHLYLLTLYKPFVVLLVGVGVSIDPIV